MSQQEWVSGLIFALMGAVLSLFLPGASRMLRALPETLRAWRVRESESDLQAAQRIAGSTQRLVILVGIMLMMAMSLGYLTGSLLLGWAIWTGKVPSWLGLLQGLLLGSAGLCWYIMRFLEKVSKIVVVEERERLSRMN